MADTWIVDNLQSSRQPVVLNNSIVRSSLLQSNTVLSYPIKKDETYQGRIRFTVKKADRLNPGSGVNKLLETGYFDNVFGLFGSSSNNNKAKSDDDSIRSNNSVDPGLAAAVEAGRFAAAVEQQKQQQDAAAEGAAIASTLADGFRGIKYTIDTSAPVIDLYMPAGNIVMN